MLGGAEFLVDPALTMSFVEFQGTARLDRRTKQLVRRLGPDDVAIIDHTDIDRVSAEELVECGVRVVFNVADSQTGRYPNPGPLLLVRGGVRLIDAPGAHALRGRVRRRAADRARREPLPQRHVPRHRPRARRGRARARPRRGPIPRDRGTRVVRREHDALPARGGAPARRGGRLPGAADPLPRPSRAGRRPRARPQARPAHRQAVHPRLQAGADRRGRRRRRAARGRLQAGRDRRRHGLRHRRRAAQRGRGARPRVRDGGRRAGRGAAAAARRRLPGRSA